MPGWKFSCKIQSFRPLILYNFCQRPPVHQSLTWSKIFVYTHTYIPALVICEPLCQTLKINDLWGKSFSSTHISSHSLNDGMVSLLSDLQQCCQLRGGDRVLSWVSNAANHAVETECSLEQQMGMRRRAQVSTTNFDNILPMTEKIADNTWHTAPNSNTLWVFNTDLWGNGTLSNCSNIFNSYLWDRSSMRGIRRSRQWMCACQSCSFDSWRSGCLISRTYPPLFSRYFSHWLHHFTIEVPDVHVNHVLCYPCVEWISK